MSGIAQISNPLWQSMCTLAFAFLVFSWVQAHKGKIDVFSSTRYVVFLLGLLATISYSKELFITGTALLNEEAESVSTSIELFLDNAGRAGVEGEDDTFAIAAPITGVILDIAYYFAAVLREIFGYFQWGIIFLLYSVSPLLLAFLAHPSTQSTGVRFLTTVFAVMMWKFGFVFADMIFIGTFNQIVGEYAVNQNDLLLRQFTVSSVSVSGLSVGLAAWLLVMLFMLVALYFLAPVLVYLIFSGASPAGGIAAALGTTIGGATAFSRMSSNLASSRKNSGGGGGLGGGGGAKSPIAASAASALSSLSSAGSSASMMGLGSSEVTQRQQSKKS
jgi:hypothetical protein